MQSFLTICAYNNCHMFYHAITLMLARFKSMQERQHKQNCLAGLATKNSGGTITHLRRDSMTAATTYSPLGTSLVKVETKLYER